jgi:hypothetical protein
MHQTQHAIQHFHLHDRDHVYDTRTTYKLDQLDIGSCGWYACSVDSVLKMCLMLEVLGILIGTI